MEIISKLIMELYKIMDKRGIIKVQILDIVDPNLTHVNIIMGVVGYNKHVLMVTHVILFMSLCIKG